MGKIALHSSPVAALVVWWRGMMEVTQSTELSL